MLSVLSRPYPAFSATWRGAAVCLVAGASVFAILVLLQPFGMGRLTTGTLLLHGFVYGAVTATVSLVLTVAVPAVLPGLFAEERWTVGREIGWFFIVVCMIAAANLLVNNRLSNGAVSGSQFLRFMAITFSVGILPLTLAVLFKHHNLYRKYRLAAENLNRQLPQPAVPPQLPGLTAYPGRAGNIILTGDNQEERLQIPAGSLLLISTADNYINIYHTANGTLATVLFRGTLKKMEQLLQPYPQFFRCHRSHLINLEQVRQITGNAQGYKLQVNGLPQPVPVGRNYNDAVKNRLSAGTSGLSGSA